MINDVRNVLNSIVGSATILQNAGGPGRIFELYVMTGIGGALQARGYDVWVQRSDGTRVLPTDADRRFIQRGGVPTGIPSQSLGPNNASSIVFRRARRPAWEILNGIQFEGRSTADHEIDLAIVPEPVARALRSAPTGGTPRGRPRVSIECKDVGTNGSIDEMRAFVARLYDVTLLRAHHPYLGLAGPPQAIHPSAPPGAIHRPALTYWIENRRTLNVIARRTGFVSGAARLTRYHAVEAHGAITAGSATAAQLMDDVADWISARGY
jgi:hypothetical protein